MDPEGGGQPEQPASGPGHPVSWAPPAGPPAPAEPPPPSSVPPSAPPPRPPVAWAPAPVSVPKTGVGGYANGAPPFTVGALLGDTFGRYGADALRLLALAAIPTLLSFASSSLYGPGTSPRAAAGLASLLGLVTLVVSLISAASTFALLEGGPSLPFASALRRGFRRSGWMVVSFLLLLLVFFGAAIGAGIVIGILAVFALLLRSIPVFVLIYVAFFLAIFWFIVRVTLSFVAVVVDDIGPVDALKVAWRITGPARIWLRILGAGILFSLILLPVVFGSFVLELPLLLGRAAPIGLASVIVLIGVTPVGSCFLYSAYRRLVPPFWPPWARMPAPIVGADGVQTIPPPTFEPPVFGTASRILVTILVVLAILGIVLIGYFLAAVASGAFQFHFTPGQPIYPGGPTFPPLPSFPVTTFPPLQ